MGLFFEIANKTGKLLAKLTKKREKRHKLLKWEIKRFDRTKIKLSNEIKNILQDIFDNLYYICLEK